MLDAVDRIHAANGTDERNIATKFAQRIKSEVVALDVAITKGVSGIVIFEPENTDREDLQVYPCIKCGYCLASCPIHLNPSMLGQLAAVRDYETMEDEYHLNDCFECGCCSYVCPSNIPLTQYFRIAKAINRKMKVKEV